MHSQAPVQVKCTIIMILHLSYHLNIMVRRQCNTAMFLTQLGDDPVDNLSKALSRPKPICDACRSIMPSSET